MFYQLAGRDRTQHRNRQLGAVLAFVAGAVNAGGFLAVHRYTSHVTGLVSSVADDLVLGQLGLALAGVQTVWAIVAPLTLVMLAHGVHQPCGQTGAIGPFPQAAGAASALNGFMQMVVAFGVGAWLGVALEDRSTKPLALGIAFWGAVLALLAWTLVRRHGGSPATQGRAA